MSSPIDKHTLAVRHKRVAFCVGFAGICCVGAALIFYRKQLFESYVLMTKFDKLQTAAAGGAEYRHRRTGIVFALVPGGECKSANESPAHDARVETFLISKYELTEQQWEAVMGSPLPANSKRGPQYPATISMEQAQEFCAKSGLNVPTEKQWQHAYQTGRATSTGDDCDAGWHVGNSGESTLEADSLVEADLTGSLPKLVIENKCGRHPVGEKEPNKLGIHDMFGNVSEWCQTDPAGGRHGLAMGGSAVELPEDCGFAGRGTYSFTTRAGNLGFRPALTLWR